MPSSDSYFKKGADPRRNTKGRGKGVQSYPDALRRWLKLSPAELAKEAAKPMNERKDITVLEAWALLEATQGMIPESLNHRSFGLDRTEGKPVQSIELDVDSNSKPVNTLTTAQALDRIAEIEAAQEGEA